MAILAALMALAYVFDRWYGKPFSVTSFLAALLYPAIGLAFAASPLWLLSNREAVATRVLRSGLFRDLGRLSYGIYMWHVLVKVLVFYRVALPRLPAVQPDLLFALTFVYYVCGSFAIAALTYAYVEAPGLRLRDHFIVGFGARRRDARRFWLRYVAFGLAGCLL